MAAIVQTVQNPGFVVKPLTTTANSIVSRRRVKVPCNAPGEYAHNGQTAKPFIMQFDISDPECFLDLKSLLYSATFTPNFCRWVNSLSTVVAKGQGEYGSAAGTSNNRYYSPGTGPQIDQSVQSLIARLRVGTPQGFIIEDTYQYGLFSNILQSALESMDHKNTSAPNYTSADKFVWGDTVSRTGEFLDNIARNRFDSFLTEEEYSLVGSVVASGSVNGSSGTKQTNGLYTDTNTTSVPALNPNPPKDLLIRFQNSSFLNSHRYFPLFLMRNGLRIEIEFENPLLCFYHNYGGNAKPKYWGTVDNFTTITNVGVFTCNAYASSLPIDNNAATVWSAASPPVVAGVAMIAPVHNDILLAYKGGILVGWGLVTAVSATGSANLQYTFTCTELAYSLGSPAALGNWRQKVDEFYILRSNDALHWGLYNNLDVSGCNSKITTICPAHLLATPGTNTGYTYGSYYTANVAMGPTVQQGAATATATQRTITTGGIYWNYGLTNNEILLDLVKPSSEVYLSYMERFSAPEGIPIAFNRILYSSRVMSGADSQSIQIVLPFAVRSLKGILCVISDPLSVQAGSDATVYNFPSKSSFMMRGLVDAQLSIGGQQFPNYKIKFDNAQAMMHLPELEALLSSGPESNFHPSKLGRKARNYILAAGIPWNCAFSNVLLETALTKMSDFVQSSSFGYIDSSSFVLGISTMKKDGDLASGVDTSQAGSVSLNLTFGTGCPGQGYGSKSRDRVIHIFGIADAICSLQKDNNAIRY
jgi:hypothetical protein